MFGVEGGSAFLECEPRSLQARVEWTFQRAGEAAYTQVSLPSLPSQPGPCSDSYDQEVRALIIMRPLACSAHLDAIQLCPVSLRPTRPLTPSLAPCLHSASW